MKTVLILAGLVALVAAGTVPSQQHNIETKTVDAPFVARQKKVLSLVQNMAQVNPNAEYYKVGSEYNIEANIDNYTNKKAVDEFLMLYRTGFLPQYQVFSVFYDRLREEAIALFHLFYYAKDFETFYKTAAFARVHLNAGQFLYAYYIAVIQRDDTDGIVLPEPYEVNPYFYVNYDVMTKIWRVKTSGGIINPSMAAQYGIVHENNQYTIYANYSNSITYSNNEQRLSYFTEDIGLNAYYYYFHSYFPFWLNGNEFGALKERRGEGFFYFYQQLLARYYLERLTNGLGEIPEFSWYYPIKTGYTPLLTTYYNPVVQRNDYYHVQTEENVEDLQFLDSYEKNFLQYLERAHFKAYNQEIDLHNSKAINFVGNYWQANADLYEKVGSRNYQRSYEMIARHILSGAPESVNQHTVVPGALEFYQTSLRDPVFYQLYSHIIEYIIQYKQYLEPYTQEDLHYVGVKISDVKIGELITYFDYFDFDVTNAVPLTEEELKTNTQVIKVRQPRLDHKPFTVTVDIKSDVATDAVVKFFLGPKYDSNGYPINLEDNWYNFVELDWFVQKLTPGQNKVERHSDDFFDYRGDTVTIQELWKLVEAGKVPDESPYAMPNRLMLPKGTKGGYPFQIYVVVYPYQPLGKEYESYKDFIVDNKPFGYPFDRPVNGAYFIQPNIYSENVYIKHEGEYFPYRYNVPEYFAHQNEVPKH